MVHKSDAITNIQNSKKGSSKIHQTNHKLPNLGGFRIIQKKSPRAGAPKVLPIPTIRGPGGGVGTRNLGPHSGRGPDRFLFPEGAVCGDRCEGPGR